MLNHIELAENCGSVSDRKYDDQTTVEFDLNALASYTNAVIEMCKEHVRGENAYCAVMLDDLKVKG